MKKFISRKPIIITIIILLIAAGTVTGIVLRKHPKNVAVTPKPTAQVDKNTINYAPATDQEKQDSQDIKEQDIKRSQQEANTPPPSPGQTKTVTLTITSITPASDYVTVSGFTSNIFEDGGTCSVTATKASESVTASSEAFANATTTDCAPIKLPRNKFSAGSWSFVLSYSSATSSGTSAPVAKDIN